MRFGQNSRSGIGSGDGGENGEWTIKGMIVFFIYVLNFDVYCYYSSLNVPRSLRATAWIDLVFGAVLSSATRANK
jgi:hypothetical protein